MEEPQGLIILLEREDDDQYNLDIFFFFFLIGACQFKLHIVWISLSYNKWINIFVVVRCVIVIIIMLF